MRYGSAHMRTIKGDRVTLKRDGDAILLTGAARARIGGEVLALVRLRADALEASLDAYLDTLNLGPAERADLKEQAMTAVEPHSLAYLLTHAREHSPAGRYELVREKLAQRRPFDSGLLHPVSADRLLAYLGMPDGLDSTNIDAAFARLASSHSPHEALARLSGLPLTLPGQCFAHLDDDAVLAFARSARTPMALIHSLAELYRRHSSPSEAPALIDRLATLVEQHGALFVAMLKWVEKAFYRDPSWRAKGGADRLALIWAHTGQLLDLVIASRSSPPDLLTFFEEETPPISAPDLLAMRRLPFDQADPQTMSPAALLYHGIAEIFGDANVNEHLGADLLARIRTFLTMPTADHDMVEVELLVRRADGADILGSFLRKVPTGLLPDDLDPERTRTAYVDSALTALEAGDDNVLAAWLQLAAFSSGGLSRSQQQRLAELVPGADLWEIAFGFDDPQPVRWRALLVPMLASNRDWVVEKIVDLAGQCRRHFGQRAPSPADRREGNSTAALLEIVEIAAIAAGSAEPDLETGAFSDLVAAIVSNWPEAATQLRIIVDNLLAVTPASRAAPLWNLSLLLRTYP